MKVFFISPIGFATPLLFDTFIETFEKKGHVITKDVNEADIVFFDMHSRIGGYDFNTIREVLRKKTPTIIFDFWDYGGCEDDTKTWWGHLQYGYELKRADDNCDYSEVLNSIGRNKHKTIWFIRKMDKTLTYPDNCYPIELIMYPDHYFEPVSKEELFNRPNDICFIGNTSPTRENVCNELSKHFKCDFVLGQERLPHNEWLNRHRQAKFFLSSDGGGFGDERPYQLITISCFLKQRNNQLFLNEFKEATGYVSVDEHPTALDVSNLKLVVSNEKWLYEMYIKGIEHMQTYFNAEYRANYILDVLKENDIT